MKKERVVLPKAVVACITEKTGFEQETDPARSRIGPTVGRYWSENIPDMFEGRKNPGTTIALYTQYTSNYKGQYLFGLGEEVDPKASNLETIEIPEGTYIKFTTDPGPMPKVIIDAWHEIWALEEEGTLGGKRLYGVDFEVYDGRAQDPQATVLDIYIGISSSFE